MIIRKPYAFLIKNFKKIHIVLLLLFVYIFYKHMQLYSFLREYVNLQSYSATNDSIRNYVSFLPYFAIILIIIITVVLLVLLQHKGKPWKTYLLIIAEYILMFVAFYMASNYFVNYTTDSTLASAMAIKDLLMIASIPQYLVLLILIIRITGIDLNKFSFTTDKEYLELNSEDREEFEINIDIDKESLKRAYRKFKRSLHYLYQEHKFIMNALIIIMIIAGSIYTYYYIAVVHKVYKQGDIVNANNYDIKINNAYFTDRDYTGNKITSSNFVILDLTVKNNSAARTMRVDSFHIMNKNLDYTNTTYYNKSFIDLGKPYERFEFKRDETRNFLLIFKVDKKLDVNNFSLFYQQTISANNIYLRKIKLKINDLSKIKVKDKIEIGDNTTMKPSNGEKVELSVESFEFGNSFPYNYYRCVKDGCIVDTNTTVSTDKSVILKVSLNSSLEGKDLVDFSTHYGKINYINNKKSVSAPIEDNVGIEYLGEMLYLKVPTEIIESKNIDIIYTIRNEEYIFNLK